jgi:hypothetical protein
VIAPKIHPPITQWVASPTSPVTHGWITHNHPSPTSGWWVIWVIHPGWWVGYGWWYLFAPCLACNSNDYVGLTVTFPTYFLYIAYLKSASGKRYIGLIKNFLHNFRKIFSKKHPYRGNFVRGIDWFSKCENFFLTLVQGKRCIYWSENATNSNFRRKISV